MLSFNRPSNTSTSSSTDELDCAHRNDQLVMDFSILRPEFRLELKLTATVAVFIEGLLVVF